jgi:hypothetical protein
MNEAVVTSEARLTTLEVILRELQKLNGDHERRLRTLERAIGYGSGAVGMGLFIAKVLRLL